MYIYIYIYIYIPVCVYIYIYIYSSFKERDPIVCNNVDEPGSNYAK